MASRKLIAMNRTIFDRLITSAARSGNFIDSSDKGRWVTAHSEPDRTLMGKADVEGIILSRQLRALAIEREAKRYYVFYGFPAPPADIFGLSEIDSLPSLFSLAVIELDIHPNASGARIREVLDGRFLGNEDYNGHDLDEVSQLFPCLHYFEADLNFEYTKDIIRTVGSYAAQTYEDGALSVGVDTKVNLIGLFERGNAWIPFTLVLQGMLSFSWQGFYLEVYRCIEKMYAMPRIHKLLSEMSTSLSPHDVAEILERVLTWRPREEEALGSVLRRCEESVITQLIKAFNITPRADADRASLAASAVYAARNEMVHFRPANTGITVSATVWDQRLAALIAAVEDIYHRDGNAFHAGAA